MPHPYHHHPAAAVSVIDLDPEAVVSRQEAMIQAGTHAMIAEKLARDAAANQALRDRRVKPPADIDPAITITTPVS